MARTNERAPNLGGLEVAVRLQPGYTIQNRTFNADITPNVNRRTFVNATVSFNIGVSQTATVVAVVDGTTADQEEIVLGLTLLGTSKRTLRFFVPPGKIYRLNTSGNGAGGLTLVSVAEFYD